jgi:meso-butanediol dehydrogenase/(S,S)-butanediol dehydrogenase/diacetyl reductase
MRSRGSEVDGDVVVVTGGGTGIGAAIAERFESEGARVVVIGRRAGPLDEMAMRIGAMALVADAGNPHDLRMVLNGILHRFGRVDTLVCTAGVLRADFATTSVAVRQFLPALIDSAGQVVIVPSPSGPFAGPSMAGYSKAKQALMGLTESLAGDFGSRGVRVNAICPGRVRDPIAVAAAARFLGSGRSSYITGATLVVDASAHIDLPTQAMEQARAVVVT